MKHESEQEPIPDTTDAPETLSHRGIYLLPNLLTTAALFAGFYSIVAAMKGHFDIAAMAIFAALVADGLDGRVARLTNTQTPFGAQYDSLSDMVAFGIAPALVLYSWSLFKLGKLGWLAAFIYAAATALRLARFNIQVGDKHYFHGLPCPSAAGFLAALVWLASSYEMSGQKMAVPIAIFTIIMAGLMVSSIRYSSFKSVDFRGRVPFFTSVLAVFLLAAIALQPPEVLFTLFTIYVVLSPIITWYKLHKKKKTPL